LQLALFTTDMGEVNLKNEKPMPCLWALQKKKYRL